MHLTVLLLLSVIGRTLGLPPTPEEPPTEKLLEERYHNELENHLRNMYEGFCEWCIDYCRTGERPAPPPGYRISERRPPQLPFMPPDLTFDQTTPCPEQCSAKLSWFLNWEVGIWWNVILPQIPRRFEFWRKKREFDQMGQKIIKELLEDGQCKDEGDRADPPNSSPPSIWKFAHWSDDFPRVMDSVLKNTWVYPEVEPKPKPKLKPRPKWVPPEQKETKDVLPGECTEELERKGKCKGEDIREPVPAGKIESKEKGRQETNSWNSVFSGSRERLATLGAEGTTLLSAPFWKAIPGWFFQREAPI